MVYPPAISTVKISVLLLYRHLFPGVKFRKVLWGTGGFIVECSYRSSDIVFAPSSPLAPSNRHGA